MDRFPSVCRGAALADDDTSKSARAVRFWRAVSQSASHVKASSRDRVHHEGHAQIVGTRRIARILASVCRTQRDDPDGYSRSHGGRGVQPEIVLVGWGGGAVHRVYHCDASVAGPLEFPRGYVERPRRAKAQRISRALHLRVGRHRSTAGGPIQRHSELPMADLRPRGAPVPGQMYGGVAGLCTWRALSRAECPRCVPVVMAWKSFSIFYDAWKFKRDAQAQDSGVR